MGGGGQVLKPQTGVSGRRGGGWAGAEAAAAAPPRGLGVAGEKLVLRIPHQASQAAHCPSLPWPAPVSGRTAGVRFGFCSASQRDESKHRDFVTADTQTHTPAARPQLALGNFRSLFSARSPATTPRSHPPCRLAYPPRSFLLLYHQPFLQGPNTSSYLL